MREAVQSLSLFGHYGSRKYLNAAEQVRFIEAARRAPPKVRLFCLMLGYSGARISEVLALTPAALDVDGPSVSFCTLKRRRQGIVRQVPIPPDLVQEFIEALNLADAQLESPNERIWRFSRTTAWRHVKAVMACAHITGPPAMPKGLRHGFGVRAFQSKVPPHLVQKWLGHASLQTTAIYGDVLGPDERAFAELMWS